jgi:transposase
MPLYCGIDLHANNGVISIIDDDDKVQYEARLSNDLHCILAALTPFQDKLLACVVDPPCPNPDERPQMS